MNISLSLLNISYLWLLNISYLWLQNISSLSLQNISSLSLQSISYIWFQKISLISERFLSLSLQSISYLWLHNISCNRYTDPTQLLPCSCCVVKQLRLFNRYEVRLVVYNVYDVPLQETNIAGERMSDVYVKGWLQGTSHVLKTDVHYRWIFTNSYW